MECLMGMKQVISGSLSLMRKVRVVIILGGHFCEKMGAFLVC